MALCLVAQCYLPLVVTLYPLDRDFMAHLLLLDHPCPPTQDRCIDCPLKGMHVVYSILDLPQLPTNDVFSYSIQFRLQPGYRPPPGGWTTPPLDRPHPPEHGESEKGPLPPHLERNEPLKVKYVSSKSAKKGGVSSGKKTVQDENEKIMVRMFYHGGGVVFCIT